MTYVDSLADRDRALRASVHSAFSSGQWGETLRLFDQADDALRLDARLIEVRAHALFHLGRYSEILDLPGLNRHTKLWVIAEDLSQNDLRKKHDLVWSGPPLESVAYVSMVKDEADVVFLNLLWHYSLGFRRFVMIDNASTDNTREEIERFAKTFGDAVVVVILDPIIAHLQSEFTTSALRTVCTIWPEVEWVFPVDADEFLCVEKSLGTILSEIPEKAGAIISPKAQYIPTSDYFSLDSQWQFFRRLTHRSAISHNSSKVAVRAYPQYEIQQGNHGVTVGGLGIQSYIGGLSLGLHYREYFLRSLQHTQSKVLNGGRAIEAAEALGKRDVGGDHWKAWYGIVKEQGEGAIKAIFESHFRDPETLIHDPAPIQMVIEQLL